MNAEVTTIIPTYRRPLLLGRAIRSALAQSHSDLQVLVCDNASGDETRTVVTEFSARDSRVIYRCREKNLGVYRNMKLALDEVNTPYCSFLSDDDVMLPDYYRVTLPGLRDDPDAAFSAGRSLLMTEAGEPISVMPGFRTRSGRYCPPQGLLPLLSGHMVSHMALTGVLLRTEVARRLWPEAVEEGYPLDIELILRMTAAHSYLLCDEVVLLICLHVGNLGKSRLPLYRGWIRVFRELALGNKLPEPHRGIAARKFRVQLKNAFTKIWLRCVTQQNWSEAYILAELLEEEFGISRLGKVLFQATQSFRKNHGFARWLRLKETLRRRDDAYRERFLRPFAGYAAWFGEAKL
ncbi:MAG: glycosyltransferase family A protein [bacterium]